MSELPSISEYIQHHLVHWKWDLAAGTPNAGGFWTLHIDTILMSVVLGLTFFLAFYRLATTMSVEAPGVWQNVLESVVDFVDDQIKEVFQHAQNRFIGSLALTIFVWVLLMNTMDLVPVDLLPWLASSMGIHYFRAVPTADLNCTLGMALGVLLILIVSAIHIKGPYKYLRDFTDHPFPPSLFFINVPFRIIEELSKTASLAMRLFGNLYAGELIFILIAVSPVYMQWFFAWVWLGFHLFVITLQAFIFMVLTIVYLSLATSDH